MKRKRTSRRGVPRGFRRVVWSADCPRCPFCDEEPWCTKHRIHLSERDCIGPTEDDTEYAEVRGVLYGRRPQA